MTDEQLIESILKRMRSQQLVVVTTEQARRAACFDDLLAALKSARDELMGLPRSLAYEFTHLPSIEAAIAKAEGA